MFLGSRALTAKAIGVCLTALLLLCWATPETIVVVVREAQERGSHQIVTGLLLAIYLGAQWLLGLKRWTRSGGSKLYRWHIGLGLAGVPLVLAHSTRIGYGSLGALSLLFAVCYFVGAMRKSSWVRSPGRLRGWTIVHIVTALLVTGLAALHGALAIYFE